MPQIALSDANSRAQAQHSHLVRETRFRQLFRKLADPVSAALLRARAGGSWGALAVRLFAVALAFLGLAGIGVAAGRAPEFKQIARAPLAAGLAQLSSAAATPQVADLGARDNRPEASAVSPAPPLSSAVNPAPPPCNCPAPSATASASVDPLPSAAAAPPSGAAPAPVAALASQARAASHGKSGPVLLNSADANELARLPSVGPKRALAILEMRQRLGHFRRPSDLLRVKGIGPKMLARMLPQLVIDAPR
jgi:competence protein ComEA